MTSADDAEVLCAQFLHWPPTVVADQPIGALERILNVVVKEE